jgi:VanZ family protein
MLLIFGLSAQPALPQAPDELLDTLLKKGAHMIEYAILVVLLWRAWNARQRPVASLALAFVLAVLYAASDEFHQTFVPGRLGRVQDVLIDSLGAALAALGVWAATRGKKRHSDSDN